MKLCRRVVALSFTSILVEHGLAWVLSYLENFGRPQPRPVPQKTAHLLHSPGKGQNYNHQPILLCLTAPGKGRNKKANADYLEKHLEDAYRIAREEDEKWFKTTLSDLLEHQSDIEAEVFKMPRESSKLSESFVDLRLMVLGDSNNETLRSLLDTKISDASPTANVSSSSLVSSTATVNDIKGREHFGGRTSISRNIATVPEKSSCEYRNTTAGISLGRGKRGEASDRKKDYPAIQDKEMNAVSSLVLRLVNNNGRDEEVPLTDLTKLGYKSAEIKRLKSSSIVAILRTGVCRPRDGIPKNWTVGSRGESEVEISRSYTSIPRNQSTVEMGKSPRRSQESFIRRPSINYNRQTGQNAKSDESILHARRKQSTRSISRGRSFRPSSVESFADGEVWMDLPTFRAFLRKEAQLRLTILGPGWSNAVKGESRWRLEMYQKWLDLLYGDENGGRGKTTQRQRRGRGVKERQRKN